MLRQFLGGRCSLVFYLLFPHPLSEEPHYFWKHKFSHLCQQCAPKTKVLFIQMYTLLVHVNLGTASRPMEMSVCMQAYS